MIAHVGTWMMDGPTGKVRIIFSEPSDGPWTIAGPVDEAGLRPTIESMTRELMAATGQPVSDVRVYGTEVEVHYSPEAGAL